MSAEVLDPQIMSIHPSAVIDGLAVIDPTVVIGPHVVIDGPVRIGPNCRIGASAVILGNTHIGARCQIHAHAVVGDLPQDRAFAGDESYCRIGDDCTVREGATIHRGTAPGSMTTIGSRCLLMTHSHIAHNCTIGDDVTITSGALLAGYVRVGSRAVISGNAAIHQFVRIGELAMISGLARVIQDVPPFFMADRNGAVIGENRIGLMRARLSPAERKEIKTGFGIIYRSGLSHSDAVAYLAANTSSDAGRRLLEFVSEESRRGISKDSERLVRRAA